MGFLDFVKYRDSQKSGVLDPQERTPKITKADRVSAEIQHDEALARKRDITGKEPTTEEAKVPEVLVMERAKARLEERAKARLEAGKEQPSDNPKTIKRPRPSWER